MIGTPDREYRDAEPVAVGGTSVGQPFGFTGREHEVDAGLVYARARYLNPSAGAWTQPDRLGMVDGPNRFGYVAQRPTLLTDPSGNFLVGPAIVGGILGGFIGAFVGWASGQNTWDELLPSILQGIAFGMITGAFPVFGPSPWAFALSNAIVAALGNAFGQLMEILAGRQAGFRLWPFVTAVVVGILAGVTGGAAAMHSARATALASRTVSAMEQAWSIAVASTAISAFVGGLGDALGAIARRIIVLDAVAYGDDEPESPQCSR